MLYPQLIVYLFAPFVLLLAAKVAAGPSPQPFDVTVPRRSGAAQFLEQDLTPPDEYDVDVLPFVLVSTIDGALHAVDRETGDVRWVLRDGVEPLVGGGVYGTQNDAEYIVEPGSGNLFVFEMAAEGTEGPPKVRKLPVSVEKLIADSPYIFPHTPNRIFTGKKQTSLLTLDLRTGRQLDYFCPQGPHDNMSSPGVCENDVLDDLEGRPHRDTLFIGRTDYSLTIHSPPTYSTPTTSISSAKTRGVQEITYSTYMPNSYDRALAEFWATTGGQHWAEQNRVRVELGFEGDYIGVHNDEGQLWHHKLGAVGVAVYDVVLPRGSHSSYPVILPQPSVDLASIMIAPAEESPSRQQYNELLKKAPSTYIGSVTPFSGSLDTSKQSPKPILFAQSSNAYPLVSFAPPPRPGTLINGSFDLLDTPPEKFPFVLDPPQQERKTIEGPEELPPTIGPVPSGNGWKKWWMVMVFEAIAVVAGGFAIYRWAFTKATALASSGKQPEQPSVVFLDGDGKSSPTPVVRFEAIPEASAVGETEPGTPPKKKNMRRRVRGRGNKKNRRRSGSVGTPNDEGDDGEEDEWAFENGNGAGTGVNGHASSSSIDKPLPELPRNLSSITLQDEAERLQISDTVIGFGSHGTVVLKGTWGGRPVAVKRLLSDFVRLASQEVKLLQASDDHPNVIRYYCQERRDNFLFIALDLCQASLADLIESPTNHAELSVALDHKKAILQITAGVKHLHAMKIIHRDIKPQNVLVSKANDGSLRMLVSDFGLARRLEQGQSSFAPTANNLAGSLGWRAPEIIQGQVKLNEGFDPVLSCSSSGSTTSSTGSLSDLIVLNEDGERTKGPPRARLTKAVDLFALGCLYFWILMSGDHPYGETYNREANIVKGDAVNMERLRILGEEGVEAQQLIGNLLSADPGARPDTSECLVHPFFWTPAKRLSFLCDASDRFEIMETEPPESTLVMLETNAADVVGKDWYSRLERIFTQSLGKYRKYKGNSVQDLLRAMRNKKHHYQDLEETVKRHVGTLPAGYLFYFTSRYPRLFMHVHSVVKESRLRHEPMFDAYFQEKE